MPKKLTKTRTRRLLEPVGSGCCWDCGKVLTGQNRTNRDNVLGYPICDNCHMDRWEDFMDDEEDTPNDRGQARREQPKT